MGALCERMLSSDSEIVGIKYFTARVKGRPGNPHAGQRHQTYFRALATVPNLTIHYGRFMTRTATRRCVKDRRGKPAFIEVWETEEKLGRHCPQAAAFVSAVDRGGCRGGDPADAGDPDRPS